MQTVCFLLVKNSQLFPESFLIQPINDFEFFFSSQEFLILFLKKMLSKYVVVTTHGFRLNQSTEITDASVVLY